MKTKKQNNATWNAAGTKLGPREVALRVTAELVQVVPY